MRKVGLLGAGAIGTAVIRAFQGEGVSGYQLTSILVRPHQRARVADQMGSTALVTDKVAQFLDADFDLVVEAAGQEAARSLGPKILAAGRDLYLLSVGILADETEDAKFRQAALDGGSRIIIPSGGLGGFDALRAFARQGLLEVMYTSRKAPEAWDGTLGQLEIAQRPAGEIVTLFEGNAREAARLYPKNANLAAAVALAGIGYEKTNVRLIADPSLQGNVGTVHARSSSGTLDLIIGGSAFADNPKSSEITSASIIAALANRAACIMFD